MAEKQTRIFDFYSSIAYPGPKARPTTVWARRFSRHLKTSEDLHFLDAGCGAAAHSVGIVQTFPNASVVGIDGAESSLKKGGELTSEYGVSDRVRLQEASYLDDLRHLSERPFDAALACGTLHHSALSAGPNGEHRSGILVGLRNIVATVKPGGLVGLMIYSKRGWRRFAELGELFQAISNYRDNQNAERLVNVANGYFGKWQTWRDCSIRELEYSLRNFIGRTRDKLLRRVPAGYLGDIRGSASYFLDTYALPVADPIDSHELRELLDNAGLKIVELIGFGNPDPSLLPEDWKADFEKLDYWDQVRVMELLPQYAPTESLTPYRPQSFNVIARKPVGGAAA